MTPTLPGYHQIDTVHTLNGMVSEALHLFLMHSLLKLEPLWCICTEISLLTCSNHCIHHDLISIDVTLPRAHGITRGHNHWAIAPGSPQVLMFHAVQNRCGLLVMFTGWWFTQLSEKYESIGMIIPNIYIYIHISTYLYTCIYIYTYVNTSQLG